MIRKAKWEELELGKTYYYELFIDHKTVYKPVQVIDLNEKKVIYRYEDGWREYINKSQWSEIYLYIEDNQTTLDL